MGGEFVEKPRTAEASSTRQDIADACGVERKPLINDIADQTTLGWLRPPDAASGPFGAVVERDSFLRPTRVQTARVDFSVEYTADSEIGTVAWNSGQHWQPWQRQADGKYDIGGERGSNVRMEPRSGVLTWQNSTGKLCILYPDGSTFVEGASRAKKYA
jgi:hypothetical protein